MHGHHSTHGPEAAIDFSDTSVERVRKMTSDRQHGDTSDGQ